MIHFSTDRVSAGVVALPISVVVITHNRCHLLLDDLARLSDLPESPHLIVVDNGSTDGTVDAVRQTFPDVELVSLPDNVGPAGRNVGMLRSHHDYVAFSDDDSWWEAGALDRATRLLDDHPDLAVVMGRLVVEPYGRVDDVCTEMSRSPLPADAALPGPAILGFLACGAVIRRQAFLEAGGFHPAYAVGGEEELLALDLASAGWKLAYCDDVVAHHQPAPGRDPARRRRIEVRNALWSTWLRLPADLIVSRSLRLMAPACWQRPVRAAVWDAIRGLPWVISERRPLPDRVVSAVRSLQW